MMSGFASMVSVIMGMSIRSDGEPDEWGEGLRFASEALGRTISVPKQVKGD